MCVATMVIKAATKSIFQRGRGRDYEICKKWVGGGVIPVSGKPEMTLRKVGINEQLVLKILIEFTLHTRFSFGHSK